MDDAADAAVTSGFAEPALVATSAMPGFSRPPLRRRPRRYLQHFGTPRQKRIAPFCTFLPRWVTEAHLQSWGYREVAGAGEDAGLSLADPPAATRKPSVANVPRLQTVARDQSQAGGSDSSLTLAKFCRSRTPVALTPPSVEARRRWQVRLPQQPTKLNALFGAFPSSAVPVRRGTARRKPDLRAAIP